MVNEWMEVFSTAINNISVINILTQVHYHQEKPTNLLQVTDKIVSNTPHHDIGKHKNLSDGH